MSRYFDLFRELKASSRANVPNLTDGMLAGHLCRPLSPYFSALFVYKGVKPNTITMLMIVFGVVGSFMFALPYLICKIVGYVFFIYGLRWIYVMERLQDIQRSFQNMVRKWIIWLIWLVIHA